MKYALLRANGTAAALYDSAAHGRQGQPNSRVPAEAVQVTGAQYLALIGASTQEVPPSWDMIRHRRNGLLLACDWTQHQDVPLTDAEQAAWKVYRQALRDLPQQKLANIVWPVPPVPPARLGRRVENT